MTSRARVLVVDDERDLAKNLASLLKRRQFDAETAFNGFEALDAVKDRGPFEIVLLDVNMPGMDGIEVLHKLKAMLPEVEVILLTGHATVEIGIEAIRAGAFDYLIKPCDIEDLTEKLRSATDLKQIRRHPVLWPRTTVGEVMLYAYQPLTTGDSLIKAFEVFNSDRRKMAGETLFIVDHENILQGTVTQQALVDATGAAHPGKSITWEDLREHPEWLPERQIGDIMGLQVTAAHPDMPLREAARMLVECRLQTLPVVDGIRVVGIVRLRDVLRYLESEPAEGA